jgi:hypothetical protein
VTAHDEIARTGAPHDARAAVDSPKLAVGVLLRSPTVPAWQLATLRDIAESSHSALVVAIVVDDAAAAPAPQSGGLARALSRVLARLDENMVCDVDALAPADARAALGAATLVTHGMSGAADALAPYDLDVLVDLTGDEIMPALAAVARHGVWRVKQPCSSASDASEASFWPVYHRWPVAEAVLERERPGGARTVLARTLPATNPFSLKLNASALGWRAAALVPQALRRLHELGPGGLGEGRRGTPSAAGLDVPRSTPGPAALALYVARNVARRARASAARRFMLDQWILLYRRGEAMSTSAAEFTKLVPPKDRFWADPHLVRRDGRYYAFIEECPFDTGKGHIAVLSMGDDGVWSAPVRVLERDYHLSYPFVFEHQGELYMVPESEANRTIDLYRCVEFPQRWEHVRTLLTHITATDSTLIEHDGRWWLFANVLDTPGASFSDELYIFHSESLAGPWTPHRRNPVVSDARRARPGGRIFEREGRLVRPAQDCSVRYGYAIRLQRIDRLSPEEYEETEVGSILPTWDRRIVATHTLSYTAGLTMIDALQPRLRV